MRTDSFEPITREMAAEILKISLGTIDKLVRRGVLPRPQRLGDSRKLYWLPELFHASVRRALQTQDLGEAGENADHPAGSEAQTRQNRLTPERHVGRGTATDRAAKRTRARVKKLNS